MKHELRESTVACGWCRFVVLFLFFATIVTNGVLAQSVAEPSAVLTVAVSRDEVQIAEPFNLEMKVVAKPGSRIAFPDPPVAIGPFDVIELKDRFDVPVEGDPKSRLWKRTLMLETIETGRLEIPSIEVSVADSNSRSQIVRSKPITVEVASVVAADADLSQFHDLAQLHDVETATALPFAWQKWVAGLAAIGLVGTGLVLLMRRSRFLSPTVWALAELDDVPQHDVVKLEKVLRTFLAARFGFPAESYTAAQAITALQEKGTAEESLLNLKEILTRSERAKFGGVELSASEAERLFASGRQLIRQLDQSQGVG